MASNRPAGTCSPTPWSTPTPPTSDRAGFGDEVDAIREHHAAGDRDGALAAVSDRMIDAIDLVGDADAVRRMVDDYVEAGLDVPVLMPLPWGPDRRAVLEATMLAVAPARQASPAPATPRP